MVEPRSSRNQTPSAEGEHRVIRGDELVVDHEALFTSRPIVVTASSGIEAPGVGSPLGDAMTKSRPSGLADARTAARMSRHSDLITTKKNR